MLHVWGRGEVHTGIWWGKLKERDHLRDTGVDGRIILRWIFRKCFAFIRMLAVLQISTP